MILLKVTLKAILIYKVINVIYNKSLHPELMHFFIS